MNFIIEAFKYVIGDPFFMPSMTFITMVGIFIGAVIYDGVLKDVMKMVVSLTCYAVLIATVNLTRILPVISTAVPI